MDPEVEKVRLAIDEGDLKRRQHLAAFHGDCHQDGCAVCRSGDQRRDIVLGVVNDILYHYMENGMSPKVAVTRIKEQMGRVD